MKVTAADKANIFDKVREKYKLKEEAPNIASFTLKGQSKLAVSLERDSSGLAIDATSSAGTESTDSFNNMGSFMEAWTEICDKHKVSTKTAKPVTDFARDYYEAVAGESVEKVTAASDTKKTLDKFKKAAQSVGLQIYGDTRVEPYVQLEDFSNEDGFHQPMLYCELEDKCLSMSVVDAEGDERMLLVAENLKDFEKALKDDGEGYTGDKALKLAKRFYELVGAETASPLQPATEVPYAEPQTELERELKTALNLPQPFTNTSTSPGIRETVVQSTDLFETGARFAKTLEALGFRQEQVQEKIEPENTQAVTLAYRKGKTIVWLMAKTPTVVSVGLWEPKAETAAIKDPYSVFDALATKYKARVTFHPAGKFHTADVPGLVQTEDGDMSLTILQNGDSFGVTLYDETGEDAAFTAGQSSLKSFMSKWNSIVRKLGISQNYVTMVNNMAKEFFTQVEASKVLSKVQARLSVETARPAFETLKPILFGILSPSDIKELCNMPNTDGVFVTEAIMRRLKTAFKEAGWTIKSDANDDLYGGLQYLAVKRGEPSLVMSEDMEMLDNGDKAYIRLECLPVGKMYPKEFASNPIYTYEIRKGKRRVKKLSLSTKVPLKPLELIMHLTQWAQDEQVNPSLYSIVTLKDGEPFANSSDNDKGHIIKPKSMEKSMATEKASKAPQVFTNFDQWEKACGLRDLYVTYNNQERTAAAYLPPKNKRSVRGDQVGSYSDVLNKGWLFDSAKDFEQFDFPAE